MNTRLVRSAFLAASLAMLVAAFAPAAHAAPPKGDSFAQPVSIKLNETKTITGVEQATLEIGSFEATSCDPGGDSTHSVWFGFTMPIAGMVELSAAGTWFTGDDHVSDLAVISVLNVDLFPGAHIACDADFSPRIDPVYLTAGDYRVRIASTYDKPVTRASQARLSLRLHALDNFLDDPYFEQPLGEAWMVKKAGSPPVVTRECPSTCRIHFGGKAGAAIKNSVAWPAGIKVKTGDFLLIVVEFNATPASGADAKIGLTITYKDGSTSKGNVVRHPVWTSTGSSVGFAGVPVELTRKQVSKVTVTITSPAATDVFNVTGAGVNIFSGGGVREAAPLPVPTGP